MKRKNIVVYSLKGGVGKTSIAMNLAISLGYSVITNDVYSPIDKILPQGRTLKLMPDQELPERKHLKDKGIIFDFGGYLDQRVSDAVKMSGIILIPIIESDDLNIQGLLSTIGEIGKISKNIVVILNKMGKEERKVMKKSLKSSGFNYPVFELKSSKALIHVIKEKKSVSEIVDEGGLKAYLYSEVRDQFDKIIRHIEKIFN